MPLKCSNNAQCFCLTKMLKKMLAKCSKAYSRLIDYPRLSLIIDQSECLVCYVFLHWVASLFSALRYLETGFFLSQSERGKFYMYIINNANEKFSTSNCSKNLSIRVRLFASSILNLLFTFKMFLSLKYI